MAIRPQIGAFLVFVLSAALLLPVALWLRPAQTSHSPDKTSSGKPDAQLSRKADDPYTIYVDGLDAYSQKDETRLASILKRAGQTPMPAANQAYLGALLLNLRRDPEGAMIRLNEAMEDHLVRPRALALAGEILFQTGDLNRAESMLKAALLADPNQADPHRYLSAYYYDIGAMDNALLHLQHVARLVPTDARPWRTRGVILSDFERHLEAIEAYEEALKRDLRPHVKREVHAELAACLLAARRPAQSLKHLEHCDATAEVESLRADCQLSLGDYDAAQQSLALAFSLNPNHARSLMIKATLAREQGDLGLAEETLQHAVSKHPYEFDLRAQLMSVLAALGKEDLAREQRKEMERLQALRAKFTELHHQSMRDPTSADLRFKLGQTAEQLGKLEMAGSWYRAALALDPTITEAELALQAVTKELRSQ